MFGLFLFVSPESPPTGKRAQFRGLDCGLKSLARAAYHECLRQAFSQLPPDQQKLLLDQQKTPGENSFQDELDYQDPQVSPFVHDVNFWIAQILDTYLHDVWLDGEPDQSTMDIPDRARTMVRDHRGLTKSEMNIEMIGAINRLYNNCFSGRALFTYEDPIGYTIKFEYPDRSAIRYFDKLADEYSQAKAALLNEHLCKYEESAVIFEKLGWTYEAKHMRQKKTVTNMQRLLGL